MGSSFTKEKDVVIFRNALDTSQEDFDNIVKTITEDKVEVKEVKEENPSGWKLFYNKLKFWL